MTDDKENYSIKSRKGKLINLIMTKKILFALMALTLILGCEREFENLEPQERYKRAYSIGVCDAMAVSVEKYKENPNENHWGSQGISTPERRDRFVIALGSIGLKLLMRSYQVPKDYDPDPKKYTINEIASFCPKAYLEFEKIPYE